MPEAKQKSSQALPDPAAFGAGAASLSIDPESGEILAGNDAAAHILGRDVSELRGARWQHIMDCDEAFRGLLSRSLQARRRTVLPPFVLRQGTGDEVIASGMIIDGAQVQGVNLLLWLLMDAAHSGLAGNVAESDTVAVLGVDNLPYDADWGAEETTAVMYDIRGSLMEIIRSGDFAGHPSGPALVLVFRDLDIAGARDISRALLSHLHRTHTRGDSRLAQTRITMGLARMIPGTSPLQVLLAASNAQQRAQTGNTAGSIQVATNEDSAVVAGRIINHAGLFSAPFEQAAVADDAIPKLGSVSAYRAAAQPRQPQVSPIEKGIEGYVVDNMEGAVDQAVFLARLDIPVAIIGPAGTGKLYVARIIHEETAADPAMFVQVDCREFRSRNAANARISKELAEGEGKTLVFKSPQLMNPEAQQKLARQIASRTLADVSPPRYLPRIKFIALFPDDLERLIRKGQLTEQLASVFAGYPIRVPPIKDRKQAVLRWAHKILGQEGALRDRDMKGFTPDAEQAMLLYDWPGNISEMRQCIADALEKTDKDWLTPVDLGLYKGIEADGAATVPESKPFLVRVQGDELEEGWQPSALEALNIALGEAVHSVLQLNAIKALGTWLEDELVLAALDRYRGDLRRAAEFLHTRPRNLGRWREKISAREEERTNSSLWQNPRRLLREWVRECPQLEESPLEMLQDKLMAHVNEQAVGLSSNKRAQIMGVSTPTYLKRVRETGLTDQSG